MCCQKNRAPDGFWPNFSLGLAAGMLIIVVTLLVWVLVGGV